MKSGNALKGLLLGTALLLASTAFAANKASLDLSQTVTLNGTKLDAGHYDVTWDGKGPNVELRVLKNRKEVVTVPAEMKDINKPTFANQIVTSDNGSGPRSLTQIAPRGKKYILAIGEGMPETASTSTK